MKRPSLPLFLAAALAPLTSLGDASLPPRATTSARSAAPAVVASPWQRSCAASLTRRTPGAAIDVGADGTITFEITARSASVLAAIRPSTVVYSTIDPWLRRRALGITQLERHGARGSATLHIVDEDLIFDATFERTLREAVDECLK